MKMLSFIIGLIIFIRAPSAMEEITLYKFTENNNNLVYIIPESSRFTTKRLEEDAPDIVYYLSKPKEKNYPLAIVCGGSSSKEDVVSIIHFHRYFLKEFMDLGVGVLTVEQRGVDGVKVDVQEFIKQYTRSQRLQDHQTVIEHLKVNPLIGWNGKLIFLGVSEGGPLVTSLTQEYSNIALATLNWCGAGDWSWREELWVFLKHLQNLECPHNSKFGECTTCAELVDLSREQYDIRMNDTLNSPTTEEYFLNMTNKYHADALQYPLPSYKKICTPFLVVSGEQDTIIHSSDAFVEKAKKANVPITYLRVPEMDHYIRKKPEIVEKSFEWLKKVLL